MNVPSYHPKFPPFLYSHASTKKYNKNQIIFSSPPPNNTFFLLTWRCVKIVSSPSTSKLFLVKILLNFELRGDQWPIWRVNNNPSIQLAARLYLPPPPYTYKSKIPPSPALLMTSSLPIIHDLCTHSVLIETNLNKKKRAGRGKLNFLFGCEGLETVITSALVLPSFPI